ncbi:MAG TPA: response regulator [Acidobacteriaceae bacterium]|jgi:DNA-binding response OmpR family regulator|nr:response regulator [Acidobacteriaceae bacterium]
MPLSSAEPESPRVYIVDDEWIIAETLATILNRNGFRATPFHNSSQALVRALGAPPDVLITDVMMPGMSGIELAIALRRAGLDCRIFLFSGQTGAVDLVSEASRRGFDFDLLDKPLHPLQLLMRLRNLTRRAPQTPATSPADTTARPEPDSGSQPAA